MDTIILQVAMNSPAFLYFFPPAPQQLLSFTQLPDCHSLSLPHIAHLPSTAHTINSLEPFDTFFYPVSFSAAAIASNCQIALNHNFPQPPSPSYQSDPQQQSDKEAPEFTPPVSPSPKKGNNALKIEESLLPGELSGSCRKKPMRALSRSKVDRDYNPHKLQKKARRKRTHENQNRNVIPNQVNQIISFIQKRSKSGHLLSRLFARFPERQSYSIPRFYLYQSLLKERAGQLSSERSLGLIGELYQPECRIWPLDEQRYYSKLCRLLVRHFLLEDSIFIILTSRRMKRQKKIDHLRARREVAARVLRMLGTA